jgi:nucleoside 2-deoxyribosyltransferase
VFLPQSLRTDDGRRPDAATIFDGCKRGVDECDAVVGLIDGADVDSGTAWEIGYAYALGKPIISLRTDYRGAEAGPVNIMLQFSALVLVMSEDPLGAHEEGIEALVAALRELDNGSGSRVSNDDVGA